MMDDFPHPINYLRNIIEEFSNKYAFNSIYLFGSYFDGTYTNSSDIDLAVFYQ